MDSLSVFLFYVSFLNILISCAGLMHAPAYTHVCVYVCIHIRVYAHTKIETFFLLFWHFIMACANKCIYTYKE
jgi:hypothetical protein